MLIGDKVKLNLKEEIKIAKKNKKVKLLVAFWEAIDGREGVIEKIDGEDIWVRGSRKGVLRLFNKDVLEKL